MSVKKMMNEALLSRATDNQRIAAACHMMAAYDLKAGNIRMATHFQHEAKHYADLASRQVAMITR